jgi:hypothetical protein
MDKFPNKRDFWYIFSMFILIDIFIIVQVVQTPSILSEKLEFASTLTSIILSVIAIIYTLVDSSINKQASAKIIEASSIISSVTNEVNTSTTLLSALTEDLTQLEMDKKLTKLQDMLTHIEMGITSMNDSVVCDISEIKTTIKSIPPISNKSSNEKNEDLLKQNLGIIMSMSESFYNISELVFLTYSLYIEDKQLFPNVWNYIKDEYKDNFSYKNGLWSSLYGMLNYFKCLTWDNKTKKITYITQEIKPFIEKYVENNKEKAEKIKIFVKKA